MKQILILLVISGLYMHTSVQGQVPQAIKYQAVARNPNGAILSNNKVGLIISILKGNENGREVYKEAHLAITNNSGLFNLEIGRGTKMTGEFASIQWGDDNYYLKIELDTDDGIGYRLMGTSQMLAVPYALEAANAANADSAQIAQIATEAIDAINAQKLTLVSPNGTHFCLMVDDLGNITTSKEENAVTVFPLKLDFGKTDTELALEITNNGTTDWIYDISLSRTWLKVIPASGTLKPNRKEFVIVTIDRANNLAFGKYNAKMAINNNAGAALDVDILMEKSEAVLPFEMIYVEGGSFQMGQPNPDIGCFGCSSNEQPVHNVTLKNYYIGKYEVTQKLWQEIMDTNPSYFPNGDSFPVEQVSHDEILTFLSKLNSKYPDYNFRLTTEAEWEYAAIGGKLNTAGSNCCIDCSIDTLAWYVANSNNSTHPVGLKKPNQLGIYDMIGNVWEWCSDWYGYFTPENQINPTGNEYGEYHVVRGGAWITEKHRCCFKSRGNPMRSSGFYSIGFRLCYSANNQSN